MNRTYRNISVTIATLMFMGSVASAAMFFELGPSKVIYPQQEIPLIFDHNYHVRQEDKGKGIKGEGLDCDFCHEDLDASMLASDRIIPDHEVCSLCHDEWIGDEDEPASDKDCARCHERLRETTEKKAPWRMTIPTPNIKFAHGPHLSAGHECVECHSSVSKKKLANRDDFPTMDRCIECHENKEVSVECSTCHFQDERGKMVQRFASGVLKPQRYHAHAIHDANFLRDHSNAAQRDRGYCETCHTKNECLECHDGIGRDVRYHPDAWMAQHSIRARKDDFRCQSCHRLQTFCITCHVRSGVATVGPVGNPLQRRTLRLSDTTNQASDPIGPHPMAADGWLDRASRNFHGFHAQRNIRSCASCHQEQYCIQCHGSGFGRSVNPHGPNAARLRGSLAARQNARACLKCHSPTDPDWR